MDRSQEAEALTRRVLEAMARTPDARLREVMAALVRHLHDFVRESRLTEEELARGLDFLVAIGRATGETKNEAVLAADVLGVSALVSLLDNSPGLGETMAALLGPFWRADAPRRADGDSIAHADTPGARLDVHGHVRDLAGQPITGATVDVWQASPVGLYENQDPQQPGMNLRGRFITDARGEFRLRTVRPAGYPVPVDGPCGELLRAQQRHPYRPAHIHFMVCAPGYRTLVTQVFTDAPEALARDVVFSAHEALVGHPAPQAGPGDDKLAFDFVLQPGEMKVPRPPIP